MILNLTSVPRHDYGLGLPHAGQWREVLNTDATLYGGSGQGNGGTVEAKNRPLHGQPASARLTLPPLGVVIFNHRSA